MKRFKNLVIGGIQNKVFNLILITVLLLTGAYLAVSAYHNSMLTDLAAESGTRQRESIREITDTVMDAVVEQSLTRTTGLEAYIANEMFSDLENRVRMMGEYAGVLFSDPGKYPAADFSAPVPARNGEVTAQAILADGTDPEDPELKERLGLAANMSNMMISLFGASAETNSCFIALPEGAFLVTDDRSGAKFDGAGNPIGYDPRTRPWYKMAEEAGGLIFTDVETDAFTGDIGIVCAMPVYADGKLTAVVGSDLFLTSMRNYVQTSAGNGAFSFVVNGSGHTVFSPAESGELQVLPSGTARDLRESENAELAALVREALEDNVPVRRIRLEDGGYYMTGRPMKAVGWALISVCSEAAAGQPSVMLQESYDRIQEETTAVYLEKTGHSRNTGTVLLILVTVLTLAGSLILGKRIVMPLNMITKRISELGEDNPEFRMEDAYRTGDEVEELARSFAAISHQTVEYMETVRRVTAEKERIGTELALATQIQAAMLPHIFPAFPDRSDFDIMGVMNPAKEVGGDFYDYFLIDDDHLCMVIADVSGKGVPAALFMMASKIILQSVAMMGSSPAEVLERTNTAICSNNEAEMFVTMWVGILTLSTGRMVAANAGHEYPLVCAPNGRYEVLKDRHGFVIGGLENARYRDYEIQLEPGSRIFVYTDGLPEATDAENEAFGMERMLEALNRKPEAAPAEALEAVQLAVNDFVQQAEQFDDLTMLCMEYRGPAWNAVPKQGVSSGSPAGEEESRAD